MKHRRWNRIRAFVCGYYWLPCPNCGQMYGGHEMGGGTLYHEGGPTWAKGTCLCPDCPENVYPADWPWWKEGLPVVDKPA